MAILSSLATAANFFVPITAAISGVVALIGWLLFGLRLREATFKKPSLRPLLVASLWLAFVAFWSTQPPRNYDAGLYHLPAIKWINENKTPLGLANLHGRLGFNSAWFSAAALLEFPFARDRGATGAFLLTGLLLWFYGYEVIRAIHHLSVDRRWKQPTVFLAITAASLVAFTLQTSISSPTPDLPVFLFTQLSVFMALQALESDRGWAFETWAVLFLAIFSITVKLSALPLLLVSASVLIRAIRHRVLTNWNHFINLSGATAFLLLIPWAIKGVLASGCVAYPVAFTCSAALPWSVPRAVALEETLSIRVWAHAPNLPADVASGDSEWYAAWFSGIAKSPDIVVTTMFIFLGLILFGLSGPLGRRRVDGSNPMWLIAPLIGAIAFWLVTAPDLRFGGGYFWALGACVLSDAVCRSSREAHPSRLLRICKGSAAALVVMALVLGMAYAALYPMNSLADKPSGGFFLTWPAIPSASVSTRYTFAGVPIYVPIKDQCWLAALPCTPSFSEDLVLVRTSHGSLLITRNY